MTDKPGRGNRSERRGHPRVLSDDERKHKVSVTLDKTTLTTLKSISTNLSEAIRLLATTKGETQ
jgi:hypothetical protein